MSVVSRPSSGAVVQGLRMKTLGPQLAYFLTDRETRRNIGALIKLLAFLFGTIVVFSVLFHLIMVYNEGQDHSWLTGFYWTLTVMSTLGFGDITFHTDLGRLFSIVVLLSGHCPAAHCPAVYLHPFLLRPVARSPGAAAAPREAPQAHGTW